MPGVALSQSAGLPIIYASLIGQDRRQGEHQLRGQAEGDWLVHRPQLGVFLFDAVVFKFQAGLGQSFAQPLETLGRQTLRVLLRRRNLQYQREIDQSVPRHGERELGLVRVDAFHAGDQQAQPSSTATSAASHDWLSCCER